MNKTISEDFKNMTFEEKFPLLKQGFYPLQKEHFVQFTPRRHFPGKESANLEIYNAVYTFFTVVTNDENGYQI